MRMEATVSDSDTTDRKPVPPPPPSRPDERLIGSMERSRNKKSDQRRSGDSPPFRTINHGTGSPAPCR